MIGIQPQSFNKFYQTQAYYYIPNYTQITYKDKKNQKFEYGRVKIR